MRIDNQQNISFNGIIPVKVSVRPLIQEHLFDLRPTKDEKLVQKTCNRVVNILAGPITRTPKYDKVARTLAELDKDYSYLRALRGYCTKGYDPLGNVINETPSSYFRILFDKTGDAFITTGRESQDLAQFGINIGRARRNLNKKRTVETQAKLDAILRDYGNKVKEMVSNPNLRLKTGPKHEPASLNVIIDEVMIKGKRKETLKHQLSDIYIASN